MPASDLISTARRRVTRLARGAVALCLVLGMHTAQAQFNDTFDRPDDAVLGNGWIEKTPQAFSIVSGEAAKFSVSSSYRNNVVYRPASEDLLDAEVAVEFRLTNGDPGYPQVFTRIQSATAAQTNSLDGYILYINGDPTDAVLGRQTGSSFVTTLATMTISPALNTTDRYRMRIRATGTNPVELDAYVDRWNGSGWEIIGQAAANDASGARIASAGAGGFSGYVESAYAYDNFTVSDVSGGNPVPTLASINPATVTEGGTAFSLTVAGSDFVPGAVVRIGGSDRITTFISSSQLEAAITAADIAAAGTADITVFNPAPGGGASAAQTLTIDSAPSGNPVPVLTSINPGNVTEGSSAFSLTVNGSDFAPGAIVRVNGSDRLTTYISATELSAAITAADVATAGTADITVFNPAPGGGTSATQTLTIDAVVSGNPVPVLASINPSTVTEGSSAFSLTVTGSDFVPGAVVRLDGGDRITTFVSANELSAAITAADVAVAGTADITVFNPTPGGGTSAAQTLTVDQLPAGNPVPTVTSVTPATASTGGPAFTLTVNGTDFVPGAVVRWNGSDRGTTFVSSNQLQAAITAADIVADGTASVTVFNPAPDGGISNASSVTISSGSGPASFLDTFTRADSASLGNGWIEKTPQAFDLVSGEAAKFAVSSSYRNNLVYRPASEELLDSEVAVEFRLTSGSPGYPQLFTRVQSATAAESDRIDGYMLYVNDDVNEAVLGRQDGYSFVTTLATMTMSPGLNTSDRYRMRIRATGTNPVQVDAFVDRWNGAGWDVIGQASASDSSGARISTPGVGGFSGYVESSYAYDNFSVTNLGGGNPLPQLTSINPATVTEGSSAFSLTVNGSGFVPGAIVRYNGNDRTTTYISASELAAAITAADVAIAGTADITVFNPGPGGGTSSAQTLSIDSLGGGNPLPVLTSINPTNVVEGSSAFSLTVTGSDFVPGAVVRLNGGNRITTFISSTELSAAITAADVAVAGTADISVFNPAPGGGTSASQTLTVDQAAGNPLPVLTGLNPAIVTEGSSAFSMTVTGSDFVPGAVVRWNGGDRTTTYISANELQAAITAADVAVAGTANVSVVNPAPGGGSSASQTFVIDAGSGIASAVIDAVIPENTTAGSGLSSVTVVGQNFTADSVAYLDGQARTTTFISAQEVQVTLTAGDTVNPAIPAIAVDSAGTGSGLSAPHPFFVIDATGSYFFDNFNTTDGPDINNDWTEKNPIAFSLESGEVTSIQTTLVYRDNIVFRPAAEDRRDIEVGAEFVRQDDGRYAQLHARAQRPGITTPDLLESYIFYIEDNDILPPSVAFAIGPDIVSSGECIIEVMSLPSALLVGERYRMRFLVTGENPVQLEGYVDWWNGGVWQPFFNATRIHDDNTQPDPFYCDPGYMPPRITTSGATGFSKWRYATDHYDNYYWLDLSDGPETPSVTDVSPGSAEEGGASFQLIVNGSNFAPTSVVQWNSQNRATTYVNSTMLQATITAADITAAGTAQITVSTPPPQGGVSNAVNFEVYAENQQPRPVPTLTNVSPASALAGDPDYVLTANGADFLPDSVIRWNGADLPTTFVSDTELQALVSAANIANPGGVLVTVFTPTPGGGESSPASVIVYADNEFFDDFNRADSADPLNGWTEKAPGAFAIVGNALQKQTVSTGYRDNVMYRPASEIRLDVETSVEIILTSNSPGYPQIFARLQPGTIAANDALDGYMMYIDDNLSRAVIGRQRGTDFVSTLQTFTFSEPMNTQDTYRLRLQVVGTNIVTVTGFVERLTTSGYVVIGTVSVDDTSADRIDTAGVSGIGGYVETSYRFDNFRDRAF